MIGSDGEDEQETRHILALRKSVCCLITQLKHEKVSVHCLWCFGVCVCQVFTCVCVRCLGMYVLGFDYFVSY